MDLQEILNRQSPITYSMEESCFVIEQYIQKRKGVNVKCNPLVMLNNVPQQVHAVIGHNAILQMIEARSIAIEWFLNNK